VLLNIPVTDPRQEQKQDEQVDPDEYQDIRLQQCEDDPEYGIQYGNESGGDGRPYGGD